MNASKPTRSDSSIWTITLFALEKGNILYLTSHFLYKEDFSNYNYTINLGVIQSISDVFFVSPILVSRRGNEAGLIFLERRHAKVHLGIEKRRLDDDCSYAVWV